MLRWWDIPVRDNLFEVVAFPLVWAVFASMILPGWFVALVWLAATGHYGCRTVVRLVRAMRRAWRLSDGEEANLRLG